MLPSGTSSGLKNLYSERGSDLERQTTGKKRVLFRVSYHQMETLDLAVIKRLHKPALSFPAPAPIARAAKSLGTCPSNIAVDVG